AWCEMRNGFRCFRTDRVVSAEFLEARYSAPRARLRAQWRKELEARGARSGRSVGAASFAARVE
ncbi:MAG TPA: WYL domain-containing protein, partial [Rhizomicrobium sp.]|nr:WYL domain-containing protein [Rhizomicrobium sp.]